jgi:trimethylamine--corrinoid protein Co-methyltransferase
MLRQSETLITDGDRVRLSPGLVERSLKSHPSKINLRGRTRGTRVRLQKDQVHFSNGVVRSGQRGPGRAEDLAAIARVVDSLPNLDCLTVGIDGQGSHSGRTGASLLQAVEECAKPLVLRTEQLKAVKVMWAMASVIRGGEDRLRLNPYFLVQIAPESRLGLSEEALETLLFCAEKNLPCALLPCSLAGKTAPASLAGALVHALADCCLGSVLSTLSRPGMPLVMGGRVSMASPGDGTALLGAPENWLVQAALTDICKWLNLPVTCSAGCTDVPCLDEQAVLELTPSLYYGYLSGASLIQGLGCLDSDRRPSLETLILGHEIIGMIAHIGKGIRTEDEYMALDVIEEIGPGGEYLTADHTLAHFRDWFLPDLCSRSDVATWANEGKKTMLTRVQERKERILQEHVPEPLEDALHQELTRLVPG